MHLAELRLLEICLQNTNSKLQLCLPGKPNRSRIGHSAHCLVRTPGGQHMCLSQSHQWRFVLQNAASVFPVRLHHQRVLLDVVAVAARTDLGH